MRSLSALAQIGVLGFMLILLAEVMSHSMWGGTGNAPSTLDFAAVSYTHLTLPTIYSV